MRAGLAVRGGAERESVDPDCTSFCSVAGEKPGELLYSQSSKCLKATVGSLGCFKSQDKWWDDFKQNGLNWLHEKWCEIWGSV